LICTFEDESDGTTALIDDKKGVNEINNEKKKKKKRKGESVGSWIFNRIVRGEDGRKQGKKIQSSKKRGRLEVQV
jgi:hypothetical protein